MVAWDSALCAMENPWLRRYAVLLATCTALLVFSGPAVSSNDARPLYSLGQTHIWLGAAVGILTAGLAFWLRQLKEREWLQRLVWVALGADIVESMLGLVPEPLPVPVRIAHSLLGQLFFATTVAIVVFTSKARDQSPEPAGNRALLRFAATATPALVLFQVLLGVAFRHGVMGVAPHILWAFVVAIVLVPTLAATLSVQHAGLRQAGIAFAVVACVQILLGFSLFIMQAVDADPTVLIVVTAVHATAGAFTFAATVVMALLIRRVILSQDILSGESSHVMKSSTSNRQGKSFGIS